MPDKRFSHDAEQALLTHDLPVNVRELKHAVERGTIGQRVLFGAEKGETGNAAASLADFIAQPESRYIPKALEDHDGHQLRTAGAFGISCKNLLEKMKKLGLPSPQQASD